jgi:O-antigen ligase
MTGSIAQDVLWVATVIGALCFLWRSPEANWCVGLTVQVGQAEVSGPLWVSRVIYAILVLAVLRAALRSRRTSALRAALEGIRCNPGSSVLLFALVIVALKCLADVWNTGLDFERSATLKAYVYLCLIPTSLVALAFLTRTAEDGLRVVLKGLCYFAIVIFAGYFLEILDHGAMSVMIDTDALSYGGMDTTNGGRFLFLTALSFLIAARWVRYRSTALICSLVCLLASALLLLNGTRAFLLGLTVAVFLLALTREGLDRRVIAGVVLVSVVGLFGSSWIARTSLAGKLTAEEISDQTSRGRGSIWMAAWEVGTERPLSGVGFRNFWLVYRPESAGEPRRGSAHGFLQDICAEHGIVLSGLCMVGVVLIVYRLLRGRERRLGGARTLYLVLAVALCIPEQFSGMFMNATGHHLLALAPFVLGRYRRAVPVRHVTA